MRRILNERQSELSLPFFIRLRWIGLPSTKARENASCGIFICQNLISKNQNDLLPDVGKREARGDKRFLWFVTAFARWREKIMYNKVLISNIWLTGKFLDKICCRILKFDVNTNGIYNYKIKLYSGENNVVLQICIVKLTNITFIF